MDIYSLFRKALFIFFLTFLATLHAQESIEKAFERKETLKYWAYYDAPLIGKIYAGKAILELTKDKDQLNGRTTYHAKGIGKSTGTFDFFFKVRDRFESWFDEETLQSYRFIRRTNEGGYIVEDDVDFDYDNLVARSRQKEVTIGLSTQDMVSAFYFARSIEIKDIEVDDQFPIDFYLDDSVYTSVIIYKGIEVVETSLGKFRCMKFMPMVVTGEVFDNPYPMSLWITDDKNRIPILIKSEVIVGSVKGELFEYKHLKYPMEAKLTRKKGGD